MSKLKITIVLAILFSFVLLAVDYVVTRRARKQESPLFLLSPPAIEQRAPGVFPIRSQLQRNKVKLPLELPVYKLDASPLTFREGLDIATALGFSATPQTLTDIRNGTVYIWSETSVGYLRIVPSLLLVDFQKVVPPPTVQTLFPSDQILISSAQRFLAENALVSLESVTFSQLRFIDITEEDLVERPKDQAGVAEVQFRELVNQFPVVNATTEVGSINVKLNRAGAVISAYVDKAKVLTKTGDYPTKTFSDLETSLGEAKIQSLNNGRIDPTTLTPGGIHEVAVTSAQIAYFQENSLTQTTLQPIFLLQGEAELRGGHRVPVLLYLPALAAW